MKFWKILHEDRKLFLLVDSMCRVCFYIILQLKKKTKQIKWVTIRLMMK